MIGTHRFAPGLLALLLIASCTMPAGVQLSDEPEPESEPDHSGVLTLSEAVVDLHSGNGSGDASAGATTIKASIDETPVDVAWRIEAGPGASDASDVVSIEGDEASGSQITLNAENPGAVRVVASWSSDSSGGEHDLEDAAAQVFVDRLVGGRIVSGDRSNGLEGVDVRAFEVGSGSCGGAEADPVEDAEPVADTTTDSYGTYGFFGEEALDSGWYELIAEKDGWTTSRIQCVRVSSGRTDVVNSALTAPERPVESSVPPRLHVDGISAHDVIESETHSFDLEATSDNPIVASDVRPAMAVWFGSRNSYSPRLENAKRTFAEPLAEVQWSPYRVPEQAMIRAVAFDVAGNRSKLRVPVETAAASGVATPVGPPSTTSSSRTFIRALTVGAGRLVRLSAASLDVPSISASPSVFVDLNFRNRSDVDGVRIYRSYSIDGQYVHIGDAHDDGGQELTFTDADPYLSHAKTVYYRAAYFNEAGRTAKSDPFVVRILPPYQLLLEQPEKSGYTADPRPELVWSVSSPLERFGSYYQDYLEQRLVLADSSGTVIREDIPAAAGENGLYARSTESRLSPSRDYQWNVYSQLYYPGEQETVVSVSTPTFSASANNGYYSFSVVADKGPD